MEDKMNKKITFAVAILVVLLSSFAGIKVFSKEKNNNEVNIKEKLKILGNVDKQIDYFNKNKINRYISYKDKNPKLSNYDIVLRVNIGLDNDFYTNITPSINTDSILTLVNKYNYLESTYVPKNLETINSTYSASGKKLVNVARISFEYLSKKAKDEGFNIRAVSAYRSYDYQSNLYNNYVKKDGVSNADKYSARAGFSEHQTGLAVDIDNITSSFNDFEKTKEFLWMMENAYKYGFILRYPKGKEDITGYIYEPWHYRYVGIEAATIISKNNITYEEYYYKYVYKK